MTRLALAALATVALAGCGSASSGSGRATVWITSDRGAHVLHVGKVPAGLSAMQGLKRLAKVDTRFGGRYVRAVDGMGEHGQRAWFYYVNGYLADRSASDYRLRAGDVEWWDFRSWRDPAQDPVVVGAFPEPFLHGYGGERRRAAVVFESQGLRAGALALGKLLHARVVGPGKPRPQDANLLVLRPGPAATLTLQRSEAVPSPGSAVTFVYTGNPQRLASRPREFRFRYSVP